MGLSPSPPCNSSSPAAAASPPPLCEHVQAGQRPRYHSTQLPQQRVLQQLLRALRHLHSPRLCTWGGAGKGAGRFGGGLRCNNELLPCLTNCMLVCCLGLDCRVCSPTALGKPPAA